MTSSEQFKSPLIAPTVDLAETLFASSARLLSVGAEVVDGLEGVRIANENRLRQLTRTGPDEDGNHRGLGLASDHPDVARLSALVAALVDSEKMAIKNMETMFRANPLHGWAKAQRGVGDKQAARLLAAIGDPYVRPARLLPDGSTQPARVRTVSELWSYSGYAVVVGPHGAGIAPSRRRGQRANWSSAAKMRAWNVSETCIKQLTKPCARPPLLDEAGSKITDSKGVLVLAPWANHTDDCRCGKYRRVYDDGRFKYAEAVHGEVCVRCGPAGSPAEVGSPLSAAHQKARAQRLVSKEILRDLWVASRDLHLAAGTVVEAPEEVPADAPDDQEAA